MELDIHEPRLSRDREDDIMEVDELEGDCIPSHTPSRSSSPSPTTTRGSMSPVVISHMTYPRHRTTRRGTITARDIDGRGTAAPTPSAMMGDRELDLAGCCFDPTGEHLYVASLHGVAEWSIRGAEKRWWATPTITDGDEWM
jgi:hypothetical protein